jgi:phosphoenolpyruvate carboxykinase (GTP)
MDEGWTFETLGDDIVWMHVIDGKLYAQNVENGFFGVAPGTNVKTNGHAIASLSKDCIFTNCATYQNERGETDVWWEGLTPEPPASFANWKGELNTRLAAHPNARYTCPIKNCPILAKEYEDLVPIHAIIFGGRRETTIPLATKATHLERGIFFGATLSSEETSANMDAKVGNVRFDPMAMRPFIGYNVCDYFQHWSDVMSKLTTPVEFYLVNWFRKDPATNAFTWKGFSENSKVLKWIFSNSEAPGRNAKSALGEHPCGEDLQISDLEWDKLFSITSSQLAKFVTDVQGFFDGLDLNNESKVPTFLRNELRDLMKIKCD